MRFRKVLSKYDIVKLDKDGRIVEGKNLSVHSLRYTYNTKMETELTGGQPRHFTGHESEEMTRLYSRPHWHKRLLDLKETGLQVPVRKVWD